MKQMGRILLKSIMLALMPYLLGLPGYLLLFGGWGFITLRFFHRFLPQKGTHFFREELISLILTLGLSFLFLVALYQFFPPATS